ncbi:unnamed protein product [Nippostrongylus brasiliensis]|uniref:G_PROTEIN_RECEP_F1_2 domain-containing protein n=1 Tax=Nippostrongylus brasiliensis TaxID=27835 RepID=A0A0N4XL28_NIPBR|nr:unnamed protein product [Nippostrongylus brasiliensis]
MKPRVAVSISSTVTFVLAIVLNSFFIYIIRTNTRAPMGRPYKILMLCSATCNILYGITQFISKPTVLIHGVSYMAYSDGFIRRLKPWAFLSLCLFIGMYGMNTALLAVHFIYRYLVLCRYV